MDEQVRARPGGFLLDVASLVVVAWLLWWLADNDGGLRNTESWPLSLTILLTTPFLAAEWRRTPTLVRWLLVTLPLGALVSFAFALDRSAFAADAIAYGMVPTVVLMAARLCRRRWTVVALCAIVTLGALAWSYVAGLKWWAWIDGGGQPRWELLSWRNQSGSLSAALGAWGLGLLLATRRWPPALTGAMAALGLAGVWLSSSRAAIVAAAIGILAVVLVRMAAGEGARLRTLAPRLLAALGAAVVLVLALQATIAPTAGSPLASRNQSVEETSLARLNHWEAALGMFADRPVTGGGLGSYRALMTSHNPAEGNLTSSAHSEWLEALAEGGLVFALPLVGLAGAATWGALRLPRRRPHDVDEQSARGDDEEPSLLWGLRIAATGVLATVLAHASVDFDFRYLSLIGTAAVAGGVLLSAWSRTEPEPPRGMAIVAMAPTMVLLGLGLALFQWSVQEGAAPFETQAQTGRTQALVATGDLEAAEDVAAALVRWNPGDPVARLNLERVRYLRGTLTADDLVALLPPPPTALYQYAATAESLLIGADLEQADDVARRATEFHPTYVVWGIESTVARAWLIRMEVAVRTDGCEAAEALLEQADAQGFDRFGSELPPLRSWLGQRCAR